MSVCQKKYFNLMWLELYRVCTRDKKDKTVHVYSVLQTWRQAKKWRWSCPSPNETFCPVLTPTISSWINCKLPYNGLPWEPQHNWTVTGNAISCSSQIWKEKSWCPWHSTGNRDIEKMQVWISVSDQEHNVYLLLVAPTPAKMKWIIMGRGNC